MKKITLTLLVSAALHSGISFCQNKTNTGEEGSMQLTLSNNTTQVDSELLPGLKKPPQAGSTVQFTYTPKNDLASVKDIKGLVYTYTDYKWRLNDIQINKKDGVYTCTYQIPEDCAFLAFKFYASTPEGTIYDTNGDEGYIFTTVNAENQKVPGSDVAWGTFRNSNLNSEFANYFKEFTITDEASEFWIKKEVQEHPENFPLFVDTYFKIAKLRVPEKFDTIAHILGKQFLENYKDLTEDQYVKMQQLYAFDLNDKKIADSLQDLILTRFPNGYTAQLKAFQKASEIEDDSEKIKKFEAFIQEYPVGDYDGDQPFFYRTIFNLLFEHYFDNEQYDKLKALLPVMTFANLIEGYHFTVSKAYHFKSVPLAILNDLSQVMIADLRTKLNDSSYANGLYMSPQQALENAVNQLDRKLKVQIHISYDLNKPGDVIKYGDYLSERNKYKDSEINEIYIEALKQENKEVLPALESAAVKNALTPKLTELLKETYTAKKGSDVGFDSYLNSFKNKGFKDQVQSELINEESPELIFEDQKGKEVRIISEDKIIVLDFWANWCAPCKKSFPAMQQLVERYQNDKNIAFYFINANETTKDYKMASASYFKKNQLENLMVLFDKKAENKRTNSETFSKFASLFNSSGIPRKVVIKNGKIRFTSEGYSGNPDKLKDEINTIIELLKGEK